MSMGSSKSSDSSRPLTKAERGDIFIGGMESINSAMGNFQPRQTVSTYQPAQQPPPDPSDWSKRWGREESEQYQQPPQTAPQSPQQQTPGSQQLFAPQYRTPGYVYSGVPRSMSGGDYDRLEDSIVSSRWAPLQRYEGLMRERTDEDLNRRGIWSSGIATQAQGDITEQFLPQYTAAGAEAATQRYGAQQQEQQFLNQLTAQEAERETAYRQAEAQQQFASQWAPLEFLMGLYNQTGGAISSGKSKGFNFAL